MGDTSVCAPLSAEPDSQNNTPSTPNAASVAYADKVINTEIDSTQVEGNKTEELLKGLLADDYCHVCEAVLLYESQRTSHYEGKKHAQKLKVYLQARRAEKTNKESTGPQRIVTTDKDRFCELCNMVFSSHVVAKSHYEGKVHTKNLRKQGLQPPVKRYTELRSLTVDPYSADVKTAPQDSTEHLVDPAASTEVDPKNPNKYCALCAASFNNPQMALQHYNGRKHQRNQARQELISKLGDNVQQASSLMCQMCSVQFNSVEMYQAHMQGNKHQVREKKVTDLCNQQKVYSTFADELADYIQVQKARGITPKMSQVLPQGDTQKEEEKEGQEILNSGEVGELSIPMPNVPPKCKPHQLPRPGCYYPAGGWHAPYHGPPGQPHGWDSNSCPPLVLPGSGTVKFPSQSIKRKRYRKESSSSSCTSSSSCSSSYSSSYSSGTSDSDDNEYRHREKRNIRRPKKERGRKVKDEEQRRRKRRKKNKDSEERGRGESGDSEHESRKERKNHGKRSQKEKKSQEEDFEEQDKERVTDNLKPVDLMNTSKQAHVHVQAEMSIEKGDGGQDEQAKHKYRKEKKKVKEKVDTRTEEEKLWDDSILGC